MSYIGNEPIVSATRTVTEISATAGQTVFTANGGYTVGFIDVFVNGSKLTNSDFTATNGTTITLNEAAQASDIVRLEALGTFLTSSALTANNPNYTGTLTGGTGVVNIGSGQLYKDGNGNVGVGTSSPSFGIDIAKDNGNGYCASFRNNTSSARMTVVTSGGVTGLQGVNAAGSAYSDILLQPLGSNVQINGNLQFNSGYGSVATAYGCRAWVNFNGTGTVAIRASGNVSSITDNGTGDYTVNFSTAMPDTNYGFNLCAGDSGNTGNPNYIYGVKSPGLSTSSFRFMTLFSGNSPGDFNLVSATVFR